MPWRGSYWPNNCTGPGASSPITLTIAVDKLEPSPHRRDPGMTDLYLASRSPRRRDLLKQIGVKFEPLMLRLTLPRGADVEEVRQPGEAPAAYVERIAHEKAQAAARAVAMRSLFGKPVITADTVVI